MADGGYVPAGRTYSFRACLSDAWLLKTDANSNMEWQQTFGGTNANHACSVIQAIDNGFVLDGEIHIFETARTDT